MALWTDLYRLFTYAFTQNPLEKLTNVKDLPSAGISQSDSIPDLRNADGFTSGANAYIRVQNDLVDLTTTTNRQNRYKEYDRLVASVAEIEMAMTVFADEACVAGSTEISTVFHGPQRIDWLAKHKPIERFPVYCYNFEKNDYTIGWAYEPRLVKKSPTVIILLDDGTEEIVTPDHRILKRNGQWAQAHTLKYDDELMPFYKVKPNKYYNKLRTGQFPRIFTFTNGWVHERQFIDEWRLGKEIPQYKRINKIGRLLASGLRMEQILHLMGCNKDSLPLWLTAEGFTNEEFRQLGKLTDKRRVIGLHPGPEIDVYDISVEDHANFCTKTMVMHNCQKDEDGHVFKIECDNQEVIEELNYLFFHRNMLNMDQRNCWDKFKRLLIKGDAFWELIINPDNPKEGVYKIQDLPPESMYRIETTKSKLLEFQQGKEGPDYQALQRAPILTATESELSQATAIRFAPEQVIDTRIGDYRKTFYPYGVSLIEAARGPAHQLRLMEDSMIVYRLCLVSSSRIRTYGGWKYIKDIDIGDIVWSYNNGTLESARVTHKMCSGVKPIYEVKSRHTSISGTEDHPVLVFDKLTGEKIYQPLGQLIAKRHCLINCESIVEEPKLIQRIYKEPYAKLTLKKAIVFATKKTKNVKAKICQLLKKNNIEINKTILHQVWRFLKGQGSLPLELARIVSRSLQLGTKGLIAHNKGEKNPERINLPEYVTTDFARLFGFLIGDGCINFDGASAKLFFSTGEYPELNTLYKNLLIKFFGHAEYRQDKRKKEGIGEWCVSSKTACEIITKIGYILGCKNKRIPDWVFTERKSIRRAFIDGLLDADGGKRYAKEQTPRWPLRLHNEALIHDVKELWSGLMLCSGKITLKPTNSTTAFANSSDGWEINLTDAPLPHIDEVTKVSATGKTEEVFDITVDHEAHNFIANGVPVHNCRAPERRVFYIDVGQLPPFKAEAFMDRMKDQFRKKKVVSNTNRQHGASAVEERWHAPAQDEDYWIPIRPNSNTKIDTLPGAENLGEIDDTVYFRNKLFTALNFPKNYFSLEDPNATRITLSAQDVKFARMIERLQSHFEDSLWELADRHLQLRGFPTESYEDLNLKMTPPSDWRELSRAEVVTNRINNANGLKGSQLLSDFDILTEWMKYPDDKVNEMISRMKLQKLEDLKLQVLAQNPALLGVGIPGQGENEMGSEPGGPNPNLPPGGQPPPGQAPPEGQPVPPPMPPPPQGGMMPPAGQAKPLPIPSEEDIMKYDLGLEDYDSDQDFENPDLSETE